MTDIHLYPEQKDILKKCTKEMIESFYRTEAEKQLQKDIIERVKDDCEVPPKLFRKLARVAFDDSANKINKEICDLLDLAQEVGVYEHNPEKG